MESFTQYLWNIPIWIASGIFGCLSRVAIDKSIEYFRIDIVFLDWNGYFVALKWVQFFASVSCIIGIGFWAGIFSIWDKFPIFNLLAVGFYLSYYVANDQIKDKKEKDEEEMREITENTFRVMEEKKDSNLH